MQRWRVIVSTTLNFFSDTMKMSNRWHWQILSCLAGSIHGLKCGWDRRDCQVNLQLGVFENIQPDGYGDLVNLVIKKLQLGSLWEWRNILIWFLRPLVGLLGGSLYSSLRRLTSTRDILYRLLSLLTSIDLPFLSLLGRTSQAFVLAG